MVLFLLSSRCTDSKKLNLLLSITKHMDSNCYPSHHFQHFADTGIVPIYSFNIYRFLDHRNRGILWGICICQCISECYWRSRRGIFGILDGGHKCCRHHWNSDSECDIYASTQSFMWKISIETQPHSMHFSLHTTYMGPLYGKKFVMIHCTWS